MSTISSQDELFSSLGLAAPQRGSTPENDATDLGLDTFLKLMVAQLNNQDPFKPMENGDFLGQIAQFGSVTGLEQLNKNFESLASSISSGQALQAGGLVGRDVLSPVETGYLETGGSLHGRVTLDHSSPQVTMRVTDQVGQLVREMSLGSAPSGPLDFKWDGMDDTGQLVPAGRYTVRLSAVQNDRQVDLQTQLFANVESVSLQGGSGLTLNLKGLGPISFNNIRQIY